MVRLANVGRSQVPPIPDPTATPRRPQHLEVFGMGPDWLQVTWSALGPGRVEFECDGRRWSVDADGGPGSVLLDDLDPDREHEVVLTGDGQDPIRLRARTLARPPGEELLRIATISDVHIGSHSTGYFHTIVEIPEPQIPHAERCLRAAVDELTGWGAQHLVIKGDLVDRSDEDHWERVADIIGDLRIPVDVVPGNHERSKLGDVDPVVALERIGLTLVDGVKVVDHGGVRILLADTTRPGTDLGTVGAVADRLVAAAAATDGPVLLTLHHQPMRFRFPTYLPPGLPGPEVRDLLRALGDANPKLLVSSGHTHRHRRHRVGSVTATEVGSTKDFPGTWAGYHVHEGGIVQFVRRIADPSCIRWTERTRRAALGAWALWAPGRRASRCFTEVW